MRCFLSADVGSTECSLCTSLCSTGFQTVVASYSPQVCDCVPNSYIDLLVVHCEPRANLLPWLTVPLLYVSSLGQLYSIVSSMSKEHVLSAGFDINTPDNFGRTCLHAAASGG